MEFLIPTKNFEQKCAEKLGFKLELMNFEEKQKEIIYPKVKINLKIKSLFETNKPFSIYLNQLFDELELKKNLYEKSKFYQFYDIICLHTPKNPPFKKVEDKFELLEEKDVFQTINNEEIFELWLKRNYKGNIFIFSILFTIFNIISYIYLTFL